MPPGSFSSAYITKRCMKSQDANSALLRKSSPGKTRGQIDEEDSEESKEQAGYQRDFPVDLGILKENDLSRARARFSPRFMDRNLTTSATSSLFNCSTVSDLPSGKSESEGWGEL